MHREGQTEARRSEDSLSRLDCQNMPLEAHHGTKGALRTTDEAQVLKYATKSLLDDKSEGVKKIVFHKVKIFKKDGKIIKKPYKVVIKKKLRGTKKEPDGPKVIDPSKYHNYADSQKHYKLRKRTP